MAGTHMLGASGHGGGSKTAMTNIPFTSPRTRQWLLSQAHHTTPASPTSPVPPPSDKAVLFNNMYLETKTNMLEIIEEGLQLKLDIQNLQNQFISLVDHVDAFDKKPVKMPVIRSTKRSAGKSGVSSSTDKSSILDSTMLDPKQKPVSAVRARVRALYEARKARLHAKRGASLDDLYHGQKDKASKHRYNAEHDKENICRPEAARFVTSTPAFRGSQKHFSLHQNHGVAHSNIQRQENMLDGKHKAGINPIPLVTHTRHYAGDNGRIPADAGDYVTLKSPYKDYINLMPPRVPMSSPVCRSILSPSQIRKGGDFTEVSPNALLSPSRISPSSAVKYATSDTISELYTSKSIKDISTISHISRTSLREQVSSTNLSGAFHSTFNYPLHSTMNYPLSSTFNSGRSPDCSGFPKDTELSIDVDIDPDCDRKSVKTTISEPSAVFRTMRQKRSQSKYLQPRALDDSYLDYQYLGPPNNSQTRDNDTTLCTEEDSGSMLIPQELHSPSSYKTPTRKPQQQLCKEHGLHPTFGGPCIFQTDDDSFLNSPEDDLTFSFEDTTDKETVPSIKSVHHVTETDCDSSYLSECVDGDHYSQGFSDGEEYMPTYDSRKAVMKMMKRQTGQQDLKHVKAPVGLSESDLLFDITRKHLSLEATRASLPDLSGLSALPSEQEEGLSESTLHASPMKTYTGSSHHESDGRHSPDSTLISVDVDHRPLSISTNDDSPGSNTGLTVPVNSPNITDSGGSSSRPNTDSYDYVEVPQSKAKTDAELMPPPPAPVAHMHSRPVSYPSQPVRTRPYSASLHSMQSHPSSPSTGSSHHINNNYLSHPSSKRRISHSRPSSSAAKSHESRATKHSSRSRRASSRDWDSGCSTYASAPNGHHVHSSKHFTISDNDGNQRTVVQHSAVARNLPRDRKKALVKKLKKFSNTFYKATSTGNLQIQTLGHF